MSDLRVGGAMTVWANVSAWTPSVVDPELLDGDHERYQRAHDPEFRARLAASRAFAKTVAGWVVGCRAGSLRLTRDDHGRPYLAGGTGVDLNIAHTEDRMVLGLSISGRVGVDIERCDRAVDTPAFIAAACHPHEARSLPVVRRNEHLIFLWTAKEALAKARGEGLALDFRTVRADQPPPGWRLRSSLVDCYRVTTALGPWPAAEPKVA